MSASRFVYGSPPKLHQKLNLPQWIREQLMRRSRALHPGLFRR